MKKRYSFLIPVCVIIMLFSPGLAYAQQVLYNSGASIYIQGNETLYVQGGVTNTANGLFSNSGTINVKGDWLNNAGNTAFLPVTTGKVIMSGAGQNIGGSSSTVFNDLTLAGTGIKSLGINSSFEGVLDLADRELATNNYVMTCNSTSVSAIQRTTGFVSSDISGNLARKTASTGMYLFPVGSSAGSLRYRPVTITPLSTGNNTFSVAMINHDATLNGLNVLSFASPICVVNPNYYHVIKRPGGITSADLAVYFDNVADGNYTILSRWQSNTWTSAGTATLTSNSSPVLSLLTIANYNSFSTPNYAIAAPAVNGLQLISQSNDTLYAAPGTAYQWYLNGSLISGATSHYYVPTQAGTYTVVITTSGSCTVTSGPYNYTVGSVESSVLQGLRIYPNPFSGCITIEGHSDMGKLEISLINILGQEIAEPMILAGEGNFKVQIEARDAKAGVYFLKISGQNETEIYKMVRF